MFAVSDLVITPGDVYVIPFHFELSLKFSFRFIVSHFTSIGEFTRYEHFVNFSITSGSKWSAN